MFVCPECGAAQATAGTCAADRTTLLAAGEDLLLGTMIGAYRIACLLGIGGMGRVYKGVHPQIGSRVAIKVLSRECSDRRDLVDRFFSEAKAVNLIRHESIVNVLDLAVLPDGRPYIVMEYLDGAPLASIIEQAQVQHKPLPLGGLARLAAEVLDALAAAHATGIIHRDLKPDNIFVTPAGRAKVLDFGIAKLQPELGGSATHTGSLLGTPHYMSPEQAAARPIDPRADLYAIGVILFECVTLRRPFMAESLFDLLREHIEMPPPSISALRPDVPPALEHVIYTALAKQPSQRYDTAAAMSQALQHATEQLPPAQWEPVVPAQGPRASAGGWQSNRPASWGSNTRTRPQRPSNQVPLHHATTVSAGQVTASARKGRALWVAVLALVLVGGGVTALVISGRGVGDHGAPISASADPVSGSAAAPVTSPAPSKAPEPTAPPLVPPRQDPPHDVGATKAVPTAPGATPGKPVASTSSIPVTPSTTAAIATSPSPAPGGWFQRHAVGPSGFDAKHADVDSFIAFAILEARRNVPDAEMTRIDVDGVFSDGHADLTLPSFASDHGSIDVRFISPSHAKPDPSVPRGVPQQRNCEFRVMIEPGGGEIYGTTSECTEQPIARPRCSVAAVWKKVLALKPDLHDAVASVGFWAARHSSVGRWSVDIRGDSPGQKLFSDWVVDDCH